MAIFDQIIGSLTGESSLRRIRDRSIQAGRSAYDPNILNPQIGVAQQQAVQGIDEGSYRRDVLNQLFRPVSSAVYGGNQAAAIAGASAQDMARTRALGSFESQLAQQDIQAKQAGAEKLGQLQSSQLQLQGQRDAYTQQVNAEFEAEVDSRRRQLGTSLVNFGIQAVGGPQAIGGAIAGGVSKGFAGLKGLLEQAPAGVTDMVEVGSPFKGASLFGQSGSFSDGLFSTRQLANAPQQFLQKPTFAESLMKNIGNFGVQQATQAATEAVIPQAASMAPAVPSRSAIPNQPMIMRQPGQPLLPDDIFAQPTNRQTGGASGFFELPAGQPTTEQILSGQARPSVGQGVGTFNPFVEIPRAIVNDLSRLGNFFNREASKTAPIRLESIQNSPQMERQLVGMIKNQPRELQNYSPEIQRYLLNKYSDLRGLYR
jgi:hypothetical protein